MDQEAIKRRHKYFARTGFYTFLFKNVFKVLSIIVAVLIAVIVLEKWVLDTDKLFSSLFVRMPDFYVFLLFTLSESFLGLIPPDVFIIWAKGFDHTWLVIGFLALISYLGGFVSYYIGYRIREIRPLKRYLVSRFGDYLLQLRRWGAVFIVAAALLPLPYALVCMLAGNVRYPIKGLALFGLARIVRFYLYALVLYGVIV